MASTQPQRRRAPGLDHLIERDWELNTIEQSIVAAQHGAGTVVYIDGAAGSGKSSLLAAAANLGRRLGTEIHTAGATELEGEFPFGVALQLLEPMWLGTDPRDQEALLLGSARPALELLAGRTPESGPEHIPQHYRVIHALYWVIRNLVALRRGQLLLIVDDLHWADAPSARFLAYLAQRIADLPLVIVAAAAAGERSAEPRALEALRRCDRGVLLAPLALTVDGVRDVVGRRCPDATPPFAQAVSAHTGGNPFLVRALLDAAQREELTPVADTARLLGLVPDVVTDEVRRQLDTLPGAARSVAIGTAVLGDDASPANVAAFAGIDGPDLPAVADELFAAGLLQGGATLRFVQPLRGAAALAALPGAERGQAHSRAAEILAEAGAAPATVALHLMATAPGSHPGALGLLRECATAVVADGDTTLGAALLARALEERPSAEQRAQLLLDLGMAESAMGARTAGQRLTEARQLTTDPSRYGEIALREAEGLYEGRDYRRAAHVLDSGISRLADADGDLRRHMTVAYVAAAALVPELRDQAAVRRDEMLRDLSDAPTAAERVALAHSTLHDTIGGLAPVHVLRRAQLAWGDGELLRSVAAHDLTMPMLLVSLMMVDEIDTVDEICAQAAELAGDRRVHSGLRPLRAWNLYLRGQIAESQAEAAASTTRDAELWPAQRVVALTVQAHAHIQRDDLRAAESAIRQLGHQTGTHQLAGPAHLLAQAALRLAQHRPQEALAHALDAGATFERLCPGASPTAIPWRATAATAQLTLGASHQARELIAPELEEGRRLGIARSVMRGLRLTGLATGGPGGLELLEEASRIGDSLSPRLEHIETLIDLGGALRRANQRSAAREPLTRALDLSNRAGATVLAGRAHTELIAAGARPRRLAFSGIESLTVSQRRVVELAARGLTTRQVAETLFVTPKTVEFHLRQAYRKLDISSRAQLAELFAA